MNFVPIPTDPGAFAMLLYILIAVSCSVVLIWIECRSIHREVKRKTLHRRRLSEKHRKEPPKPSGSQDPGREIREGG